MSSSPVAMRSVRTILSLLLAVLSMLGLAGQNAASAATRSASAQTDWERIARCESSGRWNINTGNGYFGGLQFAASTWRAYGGHRFAPRADLASRAEQIAIGRRVLRDTGLSAWPTCGRLGLNDSGSTASKNTGSGHSEVGGTTTNQRPPTVQAPSRRGSQEAVTTGTYVVQAGDCLSVIANRADVPGGTQALYEMNRQTLDEGPDRIYPGQRLNLRA